MLEVEDLGCVRAGRPVFAGLSFSLGAGQVVTLVGPNGSGKSSLLRILAGLLPPTLGRVTCRTDEDLAPRLHYLGHRDALKPLLSVAEDLRFWQRYWRGPAAAPRDAMAAYELSGLADRPCRLLSAGQRRRLALARLLLAQAPLWLLDEPTVGLDAASVGLFGRALADHRRRGGAAVVATHLALPATEGAQVLDLRAYAVEPDEAVA